jgi:uncharacterized protein YukE
MGQQNYLEAETKQLHGALVTLQSRMKTIYNKVESDREEVARCWQGERAATTFQRNVVHWQEAFTQIDRELDGLMRGVQFYMDINVKTEQMIDADVSNWYRHH